MKLQAIRAEFIKELSPLYGEREAKQLFLLTLDHLDGMGLENVISGEESQSYEPYKVCLNKLKLGQPIQYVLGKTYFSGMVFRLDKRVLIPRPETEELVEWILSDLKEQEKTVLDIGTGSGCIAISLEKKSKDLTVMACDVSKDALEVAKENALQLNSNVRFFELDILAETPEIVDVIVSNPPYIPRSEAGEMSANVLDYEPHLALFVPDEDPLIFYKRIMNMAKTWKSVCYFEIHEDMRRELESLCETMKLKVEFKKDMQNKYRMMRVYI